jgi:hypothetical protein
MSELALFKGNLPSYLRTMQMDSTTKALMGGSQAKRISIRGSVFRMIVGGQEIAKSDERYMQVVVAAAAPSHSRTFYAGVYEEGEKVLPACFSNDGIKPDAESEKPQAKNCASCPQNIAGSGQGNSRACRFSHRLAVVLANDIEGDVYQVVIPATSLFGKPEAGNLPLEAYTRYLAGHGVPITAVVTEMKFDTDSATPKLFFKAVRPLEESEWLIVQEKGQTQDAHNAITFTPGKTDGATPGVIPKEIPKASPAPVVEEEEEEATPPIKPPIKRAKPEAPKPKTADDVMSRWDDEE